MLFDTKRLIVRKLKITDLEEFHELQGNPNVMQFVNPKVGSFQENKLELNRLIGLYNNPENSFQIYAVVLKESLKLIGTVALVKTDEGEDEIGYRFVEKCWGQGFGKEVVPGLISYCKVLGMQQLVAYVAYKNKASIRIIEQNKFEYVKDKYAEDINQLERKYILNL